MNETKPISTESAQTDPIQEKMDQLKGDAEFLAGINPEELSGKDREAYYELVEHRKEDYKKHADEIRKFVANRITEGNEDRKRRIESGDHNIR